MRLLPALLLVLAASSASAQSPQFSPEDEAQASFVHAAPPHWRIAPSAGAASTFEAVLALGVDRSLRGPFSLGARAWTMAGGLAVDDGPETRGGGAEALATVSTRGRWADLRASLGAGVASLDYASGGLCEPVATCETFDGALLYVPAAVGADVYPWPGVGVGAEYRLALSTEGPGLGETDGVGIALGSFEVGLRVRLAR